MKARNIRLLLTVLFFTLLAALGMVGLTACVDTPEPPETDVIPCAHASWGEKAEVVAPTCTAEGYYSHACTGVDLPKP